MVGINVAMDGKVTTFARDFVKKQLPEDQRPPGFKNTHCRGLTVDEMGQVFVAGTASRSVIKLTARGEPTVILEAGKPWTPTDVAVFKDEVYVLEYDDETPAKHGEWPPRVRKVSREGTVTTLAAIDRRDKKADVGEPKG